MVEQACLYVVATPIGNLVDISQRALDTLKSVAVIAAEDTRHSKKLLQFYGIKTPLFSLHDHNEQQRIDKVCQHLSAGESVALISDAGTPLISDPGYVLVNALRERSHTVVSIPGPCAAVAALSVSGLPTNRFLFEGFLPVKASERRKRLQSLAHMDATIVLYESPRRLLSLLGLLDELYADRAQVVVCRELTKLHESYYGGTPEQVLSALQLLEAIKGECVLLFHLAVSTEPEQGTCSLQTLLQELLPRLPLKEAVAIAQRVTGVKRNEVYQLALELKSV